MPQGRKPTTSPRRWYTVYILEINWDATAKSDQVHWRKDLLAHSRLAALETCIPEIREQLATARTDIRLVSVHVGERYSVTSHAGRLAPIQILRDTGELRTCRL